MPAAERKRRWFYLSPDRFVIGLLLGVCLLWLSERFQWFSFNHHKGWTVLIAVAAVGAAAIVSLAWWAFGLIFRWRFQISIRSLLALCLVASIVVNWLAAERGRARRQAETVEALNMNVWLMYDWEVDAVDAHGVRPATNPQPSEPNWLRTILGVDFFSAIVAVDLDGTEVTDAGLERLVKGLPQLESLSVADTQITDAGLEPVIEGLPQLESLSVADNQITDAGLKHFGHLAHLTVSNLNNTHVTDAGLSQLEGLTELAGVELENDHVTDVGLRHLISLAKLQILNLNGTRVTDAGLAALEGLTNLDELWLMGTGATNSGIRSLQHALPNCEINPFILSNFGP